MGGLFSCPEVSPVNIVFREQEFNKNCKKIWLAVPWGRRGVGASSPAAFMI
jgi:hypothetical protein